MCVIGYLLTILQYSTTPYLFSPACLPTPSLDQMNYYAHTRMDATDVNDEVIRTRSHVLHFVVEVEAPVFSDSS